MRYVEASKFGGPEVLRVVEKETPRPGDGMLLVEVRAAGGNYADVAACSGHGNIVPSTNRLTAALTIERFQHST
jgi:NADPH2:quinone reductase